MRQWHRPNQISLAFKNRSVLNRQLCWIHEWISNVNDYHHQTTMHTTHQPTSLWLLWQFQRLFCFHKLCITICYHLKLLLLKKHILKKFLLKLKWPYCKSKWWIAWNEKQPTCIYNQCKLFTMLFTSVKFMAWFMVVLI